ncbi:hypothetical protein HELRODRAFT_192681, partial [Helobdella robusta]|uniref:USP domain-containing protein n=1 Tax=Helobdella robusta TaxID=6412 RepID=T1FU67_HELRO
MKELVLFQSSDKKHYIGSAPTGHNLIKELVDDFIFTASKVMLQCEKNQGDAQHLDHTSSICSSPQTIQAAFELLISLITECLPNLKALSEMLTAMFYSNIETPLLEWEYIPPIGAKPLNGFVGLKNAGATCYMNSVLQQLFMIEPIRDYILCVEGAVDDQLDIDDVEEKPEYEVHTAVLKCVQYIFAHLACSKMQFYVPKGFWKHFKLQGEPVNLREQHDALEFFNSLVDSLDEALKALELVPIVSKVLGGSFADQKICRDCPHRYSREESFTVLNIDIRNQQNLLESLEQYVKGDLLEGGNAYHCEKCNKKVDTVKRLCIKKLPPILAIQLKRFDYDWERECAIKFNDYFEFPRQIDMMPYTVTGLAKAEGEWILDDNDNAQPGGEGSADDENTNNKDNDERWYKFDDGDVSPFKMDDDEEMKTHCFGGEYVGEVFDNILKRMKFSRQKRWWNAYILFYEKIVPNEISKQAQQSQAQLLQSQLASSSCSISDGNEKNDDDVKQQLLLLSPQTSNKLFPDIKSDIPKTIKMPKVIEQCVRRQNIRFLHNRNQFSPEYFRFMRGILHCNIKLVLPGALNNHQHNTNLSAQEIDEIAMCSTQLVVKFLFNIGFHTKKSLRGPANEWLEAILPYFRNVRSIRNWFIQNILFNRPTRFAEFMLECPSTEIRNVFMRMMVYLAHFSRQDGPCSPSITPLYPSQESNMTSSDHILRAMLSLLKKEVSEHSRHLPQYFQFFIMYANLGIPERHQLINLGVPELFLIVAMDESKIPSIKYQSTELTKVYAVISVLVRCCDVSAFCSSSLQNKAPLPNPHKDQSMNNKYVAVIQPAVADILFKNIPFIKKLIVDCNNYDETNRLLKFCSWENPTFSSTVLSELLWQIAYVSLYELRPYLDILLHMLFLEDSWQTHRIHNSLKGFGGLDERGGLFDTIQMSRSQNHKRAYQCIKMIVTLFAKCALSVDLVLNNNEMRYKWINSVEWLQDELDRRPYSNNTQYPYNWSQTQSNETSNGYFLERTNSAQMTLKKALEYCPDDVEQEDNMLIMEESENNSRSVDNGETSQDGVDEEKLEQLQNQLKQLNIQQSTSVENIIDNETRISSSSSSLNNNNNSNNNNSNSNMSNNSNNNSINNNNNIINKQLSLPVQKQFLQ